MCSIGPGGGQGDRSFEQTGQSSKKAGQEAVSPGASSSGLNST